MHLMDMSVGFQASVPIVGSAIPLAVGAALSFTMDKSDKIATVFFGDAALEEGAWHESANFAKMRNLPVIFVCANNLYSVYSPLNQRQPTDDLPRLARAHLIDVLEADGNDVEAVYETATKAVEKARSGAGPVFLYYPTYRYKEHCGPNFDDHLGYRPDDEVAEWKRRDPLSNYGKALRERGVLDDGIEAAMRDELSRIAESGFDFAKKSPLPTSETAFEHVYA